MSINVNVNMKQFDLFGNKLCKQTIQRLQKDVSSVSTLLWPGGKMRILEYADVRML